MSGPDANLKGLLTQGFEEFKKTSKDFQAVTSALANYRQTCLIMYEAGSKLIAEMKKLSEHEAMNKYISEIAKITTDLEQTEKSRYHQQNQLWEVTLSPLVSTEEFDLKQNQVTEKQVKNSFQKLDSQLKREQRALVKQNKKKAPDSNMINAIQTKIDTLKSNQADLWLYFLSYKDLRYHKWLTSLAAVADITYNYHAAGQQALSDQHWKAVVDMKPTELPQMTFVEAPKPPPNPPKIVSEQEVKVGETSTIKYGYLVKQGAKVKNWKKRWFVLNYDKLMYYKTSNVAKDSPLGEISLNEVRMCELSRDLNKDHCFVLRAPNRDYNIYAESDSQMQEWLEALEKAMPGKIVKTTTDDLRQLKGYSTLSIMENDPADDWQMYYSDEGQEYWCNEKTGETSWEKPSRLY